MEKIEPRRDVAALAVIPANEWHRHGARPDSPMCHLSTHPGGPTVWAPEVMHDWHTYVADAPEDG